MSQDKAAPARDAGERAIDNVVDGATDVAQEGWSGLKELLGYAPLEYFGVDNVTLGTLIGAIVVLLAAFGLSMVMRRMLVRFGKRRPSTNQAALYTVSRLMHYLLLVVGFLIALNVAGVPLSQFAVFAGAIGVGLGFGLQAIFSNFISGIILLFDRSLKVGDFVELESDIRGVVKAINIRATRITTNDNIDVLVPNSEFVTKRVVNWTHGSVNRRVRVPFGVAYGVDKELVKKAALEAASRVPFTLSMEGDKRPQVWLVGFGDSSVDFILAVWLTEAAARRNAAIKAAYLWELDTALKEYGIEIPFPQQDLNVRTLFGLSGEDAIAALRGEAAPAKKAAAAKEEPKNALDERERAELSRNDAKDYAEQAIVEDAREAESQRKAEQEAAMDGGGEAAPKKSEGS